MRRSTVGLLLLLAVLSAACADDGPAASPGTTEPRPTSTRQPPPPTTTPTGAPSTETTGSTTSVLGECPSRPTGSSPAGFDPDEGTYAVQSLTRTGGREVRFDVVQWLSGEDADEAYRRETGDRDGAPNDYYIVNASDRMRTAPVAGDARVLALDGVASLHDVPLSAVPGDSSFPTFWLTFRDGEVTEICQQYQP